MNIQLTFKTCESYERIEPPRPGDRFTWRDEQWVCVDTEPHNSGRIVVLAVNLSDGRDGMPFADEIHTIFRRRN